MDIKRKNGVKSFRIVSHNKRVLMWIIILLILLILVLFNLSNVNGSGRSIRGGNSNEINLANANINSDSGEIKVWVKFSNSSKILKSGKSVRSELSTKQEIKIKFGKNKIKQDFGSRISMSVSQSELEALKKMDGVESVTPVKIRSLMLQDSVKIVNASLSGSLVVNGVNLTGAGQTVCIIDSGVNYSHSDLGSCYGNNSLSSNCKVIGGIDYCADDIDCSTMDDDPMDVLGHGTHVSGIVAANGTIRGVAPDARIIMIKAANSSGSLSDPDIIAGMEWCTNNASIFNISVISMSFGGDLYNSYCNDDILAPYINAAVAKNISVVISSGNSESITKISSPACVESAIPVGASDKSDNVASYSNTNSILQLLAPGGEETNPRTQINSTSVTGRYEGMQGTSMAAPHVSGAIAIINQYLSASGKTRTPSQIESILNSTGKPIVDVSALIFYRINIYVALMSFNITSSLQSPANNSASNNNFSNFSCYSETGINSSLINTTFYLWNSTKNLIYNETKNISGVINTTIFNYSFSLE